MGIFSRTKTPRVSMATLGALASIREVGKRLQESSEPWMLVLKLMEYTSPKDTKVAVSDIRESAKLLESAADRAFVDPSAENYASLAHAIDGVLAHFADRVSLANEFRKSVMDSAQTSGVKSEGRISTVDFGRKVAARIGFDVDSALSDVLTERFVTCTLADAALGNLTRDWLEINAPWAV